MQTLALLLIAGSGVWLAAMAACEFSSRRRRADDLPAFVRSLPPLDPADPETFYVELSERLTRRFDHGWGCWSMSSNALFRLGGLFTNKLRLVENTGQLFRYSRQACCSQIAQAFVDLATRCGVQARIAALHGHVIAEGCCGGRWYVFDPDYGMILRRDGRLLSLEELIDSPELAAAAYRGNRLSKDPQDLLAILRRGRVTRLPAGAHLSPRTALWQRRLHAWRWAPPILAAAAGAAILVLNR